LGRCREAQNEDWVSQEDRAGGLRDYFRWSAVPPTDLHEALQKAAIQAGWIPPWDRADQQAQKRVAGKKSGTIRLGRANIRRILLRFARERLKPSHRKTPYADESINALVGEFRKLFEPGDHDVRVQIILTEVLPKSAQDRMKKTRRETLIGDLKELIRADKAYR
jgi:hypothetical protein